MLLAFIIHYLLKMFTPLLIINNIFFSANPARRNQIPWDDCCPPYDYVYYLCITKHGLSVRSTMYLSEARAVITPEAHSRWAKLIEEVIFSQPEIAEAFQDPRRIFNNVSFQA